MATYLAPILRNRHPRYFDRDTMRAFNSVLHTAARTAPDADAPIVFVTSERQPAYGEQSDYPRKWTVRVSVWNGGRYEVDNVGEFQQYASEAEAIHAMRAEVARIKAL